MTPTEIKSFAKAAAPVLRGYIEEITAPLIARLAAQEARVEGVPREEIERIVEVALKAQPTAELVATPYVLSAEDMAEIERRVGEATADLSKRLGDLETKTSDRGWRAWSVAGRRAAPPKSCKDGACFIVDGQATGAWAAHEGELATAVGKNAGEGWTYLQPEPGDLAFAADGEVLLGYSESKGWTVAGAEPPDDLIDKKVAEAVERAAPTVDDLRPVVLEAVAAAVATMPVPKDGEPGQKGDPGEPGRDGKDADPITDAQIAEAVAKWLEANPPQPGKDGADGKDGRDGDPGEKGDPGQNGADGVGVAGALIDRTGNLVLTLTDGTTRDLGLVIGKDGRDGTDGKDGETGPAGFSLEDFDSEMRDGGRTLVLSFTAGDIKHTVEHQLDTMIFRGPFKAGADYQPGDTVSCGGQLYHCNVATKARPDAGSEDWTLCSRRGRDGKDADPAPALRLIEDKFAEAEDRLMKRLEAYLRSKGL